MERVTRHKLVLGLVFIAAATRVLPHPPNFLPISAMALLAGAKLGRSSLAVAAVLGAMVLSDLLIGMHATLPFVYLALIATVGIGSLLRGRESVPAVLAGAVGSSTLFFLVTNLGVWVSQDLYPKTAAGLMACYTAALPFFERSLLSDVLYVAILFGSFALLERSGAKRPVDARVSAV